MANSLATAEHPLQVVANKMKIGKAERRFAEGKWWLVAPITTIPADGILNGSKGPGFYPTAETMASVKAWDGMPLTSFHPMDESGRHTSAGAPGVLDRQGIGIVRDSVWKNKLKHNGWFDEERTKRVNPTIYANLKNGIPIETSTGLYTDNEAAPRGSNHNGRPYTWTAKNYRPDHVAVLVGQVGACSINDGCGVLVNVAGHPVHATQGLVVNQAVPVAHWIENACECSGSCGRCKPSLNSLTVSPSISEESYWDREVTSRSGVENLLGSSGNLRIRPTLLQLTNNFDPGEARGADGKWTYAGGAGDRGKTLHKHSQAAHDAVMELATDKGLEKHLAGAITTSESAAKESSVGNHGLASGYHVAAATQLNQAANKVGRGSFWNNITLGLVGRKANKEAADKIRGAATKHMYAGGEAGGNSGFGGANKLTDDAHEATKSADKHKVAWLHHAAVNAHLKASQAWRDEADKQEDQGLKKVLGSIAADHQKQAWEHGTSASQAEVSGSPKTASKEVSGKKYEFLKPSINKLLGAIAGGVVGGALGHAVGGFLPGVGYGTAGTIAGTLAGRSLGNKPKKPPTPDGTEEEETHLKTKAPKPSGPSKPSTNQLGLRPTLTEVENFNPFHDLKGKFAAAGGAIGAGIGAGIGRAYGTLKEKTWGKHLPIAFGEAYAKRGRNKGRDIGEVVGGAVGAGVGEVGSGVKEFGKSSLDIGGAALSGAGRGLAYTKPALSKLGKLAITDIPGTPHIDRVLGGLETAATAPFKAAAWAGGKTLALPGATYRVSSATLLHGLVGGLEAVMGKSNETSPYSPSVSPTDSTKAGRFGTGRLDTEYYGAVASKAATNVHAFSLAAQNAATSGGINFGVVGKTGRAGSDRTQEAYRESQLGNHGASAKLHVEAAELLQKSADSLKTWHLKATQQQLEGEAQANMLRVGKLIPRPTQKELDGIAEASRKDLLKDIESQNRSLPAGSKIPPPTQKELDALATKNQNDMLEDIAKKNAKVRAAGLVAPIPSGVMKTLGEQDKQALRLEDAARKNRMAAIMQGNNPSTEKARDASIKSLAATRSANKVNKPAKHGHAAQVNISAKEAWDALIDSEHNPLYRKTYEELSWQHAETARLHNDTALRGLN